MERIKIRTQSLLTLMVAQTLRNDLSANETKGVCVLPSRPRPACRLNRPDTYQRLPVSRKFSLANSSRSIHQGQEEKFRRLLIPVCLGAESGPESQERPFSAQ